MKNITELYLEAIFAKTDIADHLPLLFALASACDTIAEFGVRSGESTKAFLAGQNTSWEETELHSYDISPYSGPNLGEAMDAGHYWYFMAADTSNMSFLPECDLLFIDTLHTEKQVQAELKHAGSVRRWLVFHDTELFGENGKDGGAGINYAINRFLMASPEWSLKRRYSHCNGLTILERNPS